MNERDDIQIEKYMDDALDVAEKKVFEARLANEPSLQKAYEQRTRLGQLLAANQKEQEFTQFLDEVSDPFFESYVAEPIEMTASKVVPFYKKRTFSIIALATAAVIALLLAVPFLFPQNLYDQFNDHRPLALTDQSGATTALQAAETAFNEEDYTVAVVALDSYLANNPQDIEAQLYKGISLLELDQLEEAKTIFMSIAEGSSVFASEALWYAALAYLKEGNEVASASTLRQLIELASDSQLIEKAKQLLAELED